MAKKDNSGYVLPQVVDPPRKCIKIWIPNEVYHRGAFWGAIFELTQAFNWQQKPPEKAREVANLWFDIWSQATEDNQVNGCCEELVIIHRYDPETGRPQVSDDGGVTWTDDPADIQNQIQLYPPLVNSTSGKTKCDAATNASEHINDLIDSTGTNLSSAATVFELAVAVAAAVLALFLIFVSAGALTAPVTAVATAIWAAATGVFSLGIEAYNAYWSVDKKDAILCALYCYIGDDGQFTEAQYQGFRNKVKTQLPPSPALDIVMTAINAGGARGLSQMASYGNAALADCSSCDCPDCPDGCTVTWTFYGVTDVVKVNDCHYTMTRSTALGHFAFTSGNSEQGCYYNQVGVGFATTWPVGSASPSPVNPNTTAIWNYDTGDFFSDGELMDIHFSSMPFA